MSIHIGEEVDVNFAELMPFYSLSDYNIENEFLTTKRKFENLLDNKQFEMFLKENKYEQIFNPTCVTPCQYFDEDEFINKNRTHFDKIFEKILCGRLISFLERNELLYCYQYGFRKLYSTGLALIEITDYIKRLLDEEKNVISIFIDFKKAFNTVDHEILMHKLEY